MITCVRRKQDYDMVKGDNGRLSVTKVGTKEITRDGFEYELTINFEFLNEKHLVKASKDRTSLFANQPEFIITSDTGRMILDWCNDGDPILSLIDACIEITSANDIDELKSIWNKFSIYQKDEKFIKATVDRKQEIIDESKKLEE